MDDLHWREEKLLWALRGAGKLKTVDLVGRSGMSKVTALKYMSRLYDLGVIDFERVGPTKLWYVVGKGPAKGQEEMVFKLLSDFEEITGMRPEVVINSERVVLSLDRCVK